MHFNNELCNEAVTARALYIYCVCMFVYVCVVSVFRGCVCV